jgi:hypothetical protein
MLKIYLKLQLLVMMGCNGNHYRRGGTLPLSYTFHGETNNTRYLHMRREQILNTALQMLIIETS